MSLVADIIWFPGMFTIFITNFFLFTIFYTNFLNQIIF